MQRYIVHCEGGSVEVPARSLEAAVRVARRLRGPVIWAEVSGNARV